MGNLSAVKRIIKEDFDAKDQPLIGKLGFALNPFIEETSNLLQNGLTITDNLNMEYRNFIIQKDASGNITSGNELKTNIKGNVKAILIVGASLASNPIKLDISAISATTPTIITTSATHNLQTGDKVFISNTNSTPAISNRYGITALSNTTFQIPVAVSGAGTSGFVAYPTAMTQMPFITFTQDGNIIKINDIAGIPLLNKYNLTLLILGS